MENGLIYLVRSGLLTRETGALKSYYDFGDSTLYSGEGDRFIFSKLGNASGVIELFEHDATGGNFRQIYDYSGLEQTGYLRLLGNQISESSGRASCIDLGGMDIDLSGEFSIFIEGGKLPRDEAKAIYDNTGFDRQIPLHNKEVLLNCKSGDGGIEIGLNGANLLYLGLTDLGQEKVFTYDEDVPMGENIWAIRKSDKFLFVSRYDEHNGEIKTSSFKMGGDLGQGGSWVANSGDGISAIDETLAMGFTSSTKLRKIICFDEYLQDTQTLTAAMYMNLDISGEPYITDSGYNYYEVTGQEYFTGVSGELYKTGILSGYLTEEVEITGQPVYTGITGIVNSGEMYIPEYDEEYGIFYPDLYLPTGDQPYSITGVTGYSWYYPVETQTITGDAVYIQSGVSGLIYSGSWFDSYITGEYFEFTGYTTGASGENAYAHLRPRSVSYLGNRHDGDFIDIYIQTSETGNLSNNSALKTWEYRGRGMGLLLKQEHLPETGKIKFYINGVAARAGSGVSNSEIEDGNEYDYFVSEKDYSIGDGGEIYQELDFSTNTQMENLHGIYDIVQNSTQEIIFKIEGSAMGNYSAPYNNIDSLWVKYTGEEKSWYGLFRVDSGCYMSKDKKLVIAKEGLESDRIYAIYYLVEDLPIGIAYPSGSVGIGQQPWEITWKYWSMGGYFAPKQVGEYNGEKTISSTSQYTGAFTEISPSGIKESSSNNPDKLYVWNSNSEEVNGVYSYAGDFSNRKYWMKENIEIFYNPYGEWVMAKAPYLNEDTYARWAETGYYPTGVPYYLGDGISERITLTPIETFEKDIFLNGIKLYEGIDYVSTSGFFEPLGELNNITGTYFSFPRLSGQQFYTGNSVYDVYRADTFRNGSAMFWINGIRKDIREYVHHDIYADLITGVEIFDDDLSNVSEGSL